MAIDLVDSSHDALLEFMFRGHPDMAQHRAGELAIPVLVERLAANDGLKGTLVSIDAIATNAAIATTGADYLLAVKANQPARRAEIEGYFVDAPADCLDSFVDLDRVPWPHQAAHRHRLPRAGWVQGQRRFPVELRLPGATTIVRVSSRTGLKDKPLRHAVLYRLRRAERAAHAVRRHWRTLCTGPSAASSSTTTSRASEKAMAPWPSCAISPSTCQSRRRQALHQTQVQKGRLEDRRAILGDLRR
ncbi:MAG: hypothetical protein EOR07_02520 [Mesorhizobium sp.]|nr:MAG: hypothetical protein EOR07_02520 [Mesorhizobium sp.]